MAYIAIAIIYLYLNVLFFLSNADFLSQKLFESIIFATALSDFLNIRPADFMLSVGAHGMFCVMILMN